MRRSAWATTAASTGSGATAGAAPVRCRGPTVENRGFLRALAGLAREAAVIGETAEAERCELFLRQLDPTWPPADLSA